jgi:hypothetical protein
MDFGDEAGPSTRPSSRPSSRPFSHGIFGGPLGSNDRLHQPPSALDFDIFSWYPQYQSCQRYFLDHAQHTEQVRTLAAFLNINLPFQMQPPVISSKSSSPLSTGLPMNVGIPPMRPSLGAFHSSNTHANDNANGTVSLVAYIRRLVATGFDNPGILHGFFGNDWKAGIGPLHEVERRNYLFAAKSGSWLDVKSEYDISPHETVPFLKPLQRASEDEISMADKQWSHWMAMQDWMLGPRAPDSIDPHPHGLQSPLIKRESRD